MAPFFPRLCLTGFTFAQPFLVNRVITYLENGGPRDKNIGYGLMGAYALTYTGLAVSPPMCSLTMALTILGRFLQLCIGITSTEQ